MTSEFENYRATCDSCAAPILWATTSKGVAMPIDAEPSDDGNVLLAVQTAALVAAVLGVNQAAGARDNKVRLHRSHFQSCPDADRHRKSRR